MKWMLTSVLVRRTRSLRPEPNVTLNSAQGVFLGPGRGRGPETEDGLDGGFVERLPDGPRKNWNSWTTSSHRRGQDASPFTLPGATLHLFCFVA